MVATTEIKTIEWVKGKIRILDQTRLPGQEVYLELDNLPDVVSAIKEMRIRGAPALGVAAAYGMALGAQAIRAQSKQDFLVQLQQVSQSLAAARPTAVNLFRAINRLERVAQNSPDVELAKAALLAEARKLEAEEKEACRCLSQFGADLVAVGATVLTHCNAGALATVGYGTALGVIRAAWEQGKNIHVLATETRPLLQGARLTAWELKQEGIPFTLITDSMVGYFLSRGKVSCVVVGADRIAANGDVANKIGTYNIAVLATENGVPFYVAAPTSTIDLSIPTGKGIPIEERSPDEVTHIGRISIAPEGTRSANPAFDVTPHMYVSAIITEKGVIREPYGEGIGKII